MINRDLWFGIFMGGIIGIVLFGMLEYLWGLGGLAPTFFIIGLSLTMVIVDKLSDVLTRDSE